MVAALNPKLDGDMFILRNIGAALGFFLLAGTLTSRNRTPTYGLPGYLSSQVG